MKDSSPSLVLLDILRGYSVMNHGGQEFYLKHFSVIDYLSLEEYELAMFDSSVAKGIKTEEELIKRAYTQGFWKEKDEKTLKEKQWEVSQSIKASKKIQDNRQRKMFLDSIKPAEKIVDELSSKRKKITSMSAETFAAQKRFQKLLDSIIFLDKDMTKRAKKKDFAEKEFSKIQVKAFAKIGRLFDKENVIKAAYESYFFDIFSTQHKNPIAIFGKDISEITLFQSRIMVVAKSLLSKLQNLDNIPDNILADPVKLYDYEENSKHSGNTTEGLDDLKLKMKQKGKLTSEDLLS